MVSLMASFVLSFFPLDVLDEIWDLIESVSEGFLTYSQLSPKSHPRHLVGKRTAQKNTIIDITSDSQVNTNFPFRWSPASLTFNNTFAPMTRIIEDNNKPHLKSPKDQNRRAWHCLFDTRITRMLRSALHVKSLLYI